MKEPNFTQINRKKRRKMVILSDPERRVLYELYKAGFTYRLIAQFTELNLSTAKVAGEVGKYRLQHPLKDS